MSAPGAFVVVVRRAERVLEVVYPERPSLEGVERYVREAEEAIRSFGGPWSCLVDQRALRVMSGELASIVGALNTFAQQNGMLRSARVVASSMGELQVSRVMRSASVSAETIFGTDSSVTRWS